MEPFQTISCMRTRNNWPCGFPATQSFVGCRWREQVRPRHDAVFPPDAQCPHWHQHRSHVGCDRPWIDEASTTPVQPLSPPTDWCTEIITPHKHHQQQQQHFWIAPNKVWPSGVIVKALDSKLTGHDFDSRPFCCHVTTLSKLLSHTHTHTCLCQQAV